MRFLHVMSVAYERPTGMQVLINSFIEQTNKNWDLLLVHDGDASSEVRKIASNITDPRFCYIEAPKRNQQYGHPNRKWFLETYMGDNSDFILLTNDDNYYVPVFVDEILGAITPDVGMVYCDTVHSHFQYNILKTEISIDHVDVGSFVVRADVAKAVGFTNFAFNGDGYYACDCAARCRASGLKIVYIPKPLFVHN